jgi:HEAT repeat protein
LAHIRPGLARHPHPGPETLRALLALDEEADFERLLPMWASRLAASLAGGDPAAARGWLEAVLDARLSAAQEEAVRAEVDAMLRRGLIDDLVTAAAAGDEATTSLVEAVAPMAAEALIHRLAAEPDRARRRAQVDLLGAVARADPEAVCRHLNDPRWYLVRNLVVALARSRGQEAVPYLRPLTSHAEPRVRREVLRALRALSPDEGSAAAIAALDDPDPTVRLQVLGLLGADSDPRVDALLARRLASWPPLDEAMGVIEALARRPSRAARAALGALSKRRWLVSPNRRKLRSAARLALGGKGS